MVTGRVELLSDSRSGCAWPLRSRGWRSDGRSWGGGVVVGCVAAAAETVSFTAAGCTTWTTPAASQGAFNAFQIKATGKAGSTGYSRSGGGGDTVTATLSELAAGAHLFVCVDVGGGGPSGPGGDASYSGGAGGEGLCEQSEDRS
jgi:hypothetical protein